MKNLNETVNTSNDRKKFNKKNNPLKNNIKRNIKLLKRYSKSLSKYEFGEDSEKNLSYLFSMKILSEVSEDAVSRVSTSLREELKIK